jgi:hypothetical protein
VTQTSTHPLARSEDLVTTSSGDELLVFDLRSNQLHHLNPITAATWQAMDGASSLPAILQSVRRATHADVSAESIQLAVVMLSDAGLLVETVDAPSLLGNQSRRRFLKQAGLAGVAIPVIASVTAPSAALASSDTDPSTYVCTLGQAEMFNKEGLCLPANSGQVCCNSVGKCGDNGQGVPLDVPCGTCTFNSGYNCPPGFWGGYQYPPVPGQGGPTAEWVDVCTPRFYCI